VSETSELYRGGGHAPALLRVQDRSGSIACTTSSALDESALRSASLIHVHDAASERPAVMEGLGFCLDVPLHS